VEKRLEEVEMEFVCDACGSKVDSRVGMMKWNHDQDPTTAEEWILMEKFNDKLGIGARWINYCTNPDCYKIWKEGEFEDEIVLPKTSIIRDKIRAEVLRERGLQ
jgi:hypothetical protein